MFSDTHFHFRLMSEEWGVDGVQVLAQMARQDCFFGLDIGTRADDLQKRQESVLNHILKIEDSALAAKARDFMYFSAGIWPDLDSIENRFEYMKILQEQIEKSSDKGDRDALVSDSPSGEKMDYTSAQVFANKNLEKSTLVSDKGDRDKCNLLPHRKIIAIGEGGLDHHWNPSGADGRCESDFDQKTFYGEQELFKLQLELAKKLDLPFIVHSRDAFEDTLNCIKDVGYNKGIIHCYSYGLEEAKSFLDLGWYISFSGSVTYTKKSKMEQMKELLRYVPSDRILCETDSPYLAPVPKRGNPNCPLFVQHTYDFVAAAREVETSELCETVDKNVRKLFFNE